MDFGPVFEDWEADFGQTYVIGNDLYKKKLANDTESAWFEGKAFFQTHKKNITGAEFYAYSAELAKKFGWTFGNDHCGHLIGNFPHEKIQGDEVTNYINPDNHERMNSLGRNEASRHWIYEIHFVDEHRSIGGFFEQLLD